MAGIVTLVIDAGVVLGLPSPSLVPALTLALEMGLEAAMLNKFLASGVLQRGRGIKQNKKKKNTCSYKKTGYYKDVDSKWTV